MNTSWIESLTTTCKTATRGDFYSILLLLALSFLRRNVPKEKIKRHTQRDGRPIYKQLRRQMAAAEPKSKEEKANP